MKWNEKGCGTAWKDAQHQGHQRHHPLWSWATPRGRNNNKMIATFGRTLWERRTITLSPMPFISPFSNFVVDKTLARIILLLCVLCVKWHSPDLNLNIAFFLTICVSRLLKPKPVSSYAPLEIPLPYPSAYPYPYMLMQSSSNVFDVCVCVNVCTAIVGNLFTRF